MNYEIIKIDGNTWRIENGFVRLFLVAGSEKALLIDTGASLPNAREIAESLTDKPIELIYTHGDGDHTSGTAAFASCRMHPADYTNCKVGEKYPGCSLVPVTDGEIIDLGGRTVRIIHIPGHTYGSIALIDSQTRILFTGDSVQDGHVFMFGGHRDPASFAASLEKLIAAEADYDTVVPCHGSPELPAAYVRTVAEAWKQVQAGSIIPHEESLHGNTVLTYDADGCGFYCNAK